MTIAACPETDLAVAKACGIGDEDGCCWKPIESNLGTYGGEVGIRFSPSTDLNHAFFAAEKFGLFGGSGLEIQRHDSHGVHWSVSESDRGYFLHGEGATAALAICAAILKLAERP